MPSVNKGSGEIKELRAKIDNIDNTLGELLLQRYYLSKKIQTLKISKKLPATDLSRETEIVKIMKSKFPAIPTETIQNLYSEIFNWMRG